MTNKNEIEIKDIGLRSQFLSNYPYDRFSVEYGARKMAEKYKNRMKEHEQEILWKFEQILGKIVVDSDSFNNISKDFQKCLINTF